MKEAVTKKNKIMSSIKLHRRLATKVEIAINRKELNLPFLMSYFDEADSENREEKKKKKNRFRDSLISRIEEFEGFRENKSIKRFHISRKGLKFAKSRNFTLAKFYSFKGIPA